MAKQAKKTGKSRGKPGGKKAGGSAAGTRPRQLLRRGLRWGLRALAVVVVLFVVLIAVNSVVRPWGGIYRTQEEIRLGSVDQQWVPMDQIAPVMARSAVAAEDANFCLHWGVDTRAVAMPSPRG